MSEARPDYDAPLDPKKVRSGLVLESDHRLISLSLCLSALPPPASLCARLPLDRSSHIQLPPVRPHTHTPHARVHFTPLLHSIAAERMPSGSANRYDATWCVGVDTVDPSRFRAQARSSSRTTHHAHAHGDCCPPYHTHTLDRRPPPRLPRSLVDRIQRHPIVHASDGRPTTRNKAQEPMYVMSLPARSCARSCARSPGVPDPPARPCRLMASSCVHNVQT
jgi:hypothetical protein